MTTNFDFLIKSLQEELENTTSNCNGHRRLANEYEAKAIQLKEAIADLTTLAQEGK